MAKYDPNAEDAEQSAKSSIAAAFGGKASTPGEVSAAEIPSSSQSLKDGHIKTSMTSVPAHPGHPGDGGSTGATGATGATESSEPGENLSLAEIQARAKARKLQSYYK